MSASNWRECPRCLDQAEKDHTKQYEEWKESYGKVPIGEYEANRPNTHPEDVGETLREDYELGINVDGIFYMRYHSSCDSCDFEYKKEFSEPTENRHGR